MTQVTEWKFDAGVASIINECFSILTGISRNQHSHKTNGAVYSTVTSNDNVIVGYEKYRSLGLKRPLYLVACCIFCVVKWLPLVSNVVGVGALFFKLI